MLCKKPLKCTAFSETNISSRQILTDAISMGDPWNGVSKWVETCGNPNHWHVVSFVYTRNISFQ